MSDEIAEAAACYIRVCQEHDRAFPLRNILVVTEGYQAAEDKERFVEDVGKYLSTDHDKESDPAGD